MVSLPAVNATLNATSAVFLLAGYFFIRRRNITAHRISMVSAFISSTAFLACYLYYHFVVRLTVPFQGQGWLRVFYYGMLVSHIVLAAAILPLALITLGRALRGRFDRHRAIARWTLPIWLYVSVTGVLIYWMLYHLYPAPPLPAAPFSGGAR